MLWFTQDSALLSAGMLFLLGFGGGFYDVPLAAFMQHESPPRHLGSILAASNFLTFSGMLIVSVVFVLLQKVGGFEPAHVFLLAGLVTIPVALYIFVIVPQATLRFIVWLLSHTVYRVKVRGRENIPEHGGALLVANHVSWIDGLLLLIMSSRPIRFLAYADYVTTGPVGWLAKLYGTIPIKAGSGPRALIESLKRARSAVDGGELVCIFAEGALTRTGQLQPFQRGMMRIVDGVNAPVIPTYLGGLWGSIFSFYGGKFFWKWPRQWPYPVSISFGEPIHDADNVHQVRHAVEDLGIKAMDAQKRDLRIPAREFIRRCKSLRFRKKFADSAGTELTGGKTLAGTLVMESLLRRHVLADDDEMLGILLPPSVGGLIANTATTLAGRVAVNLNYTLSDEVVNFCIRECKIKRVLTSKRFLEKKPMELDAELVLLEDLKEKATSADKFKAAASAFLEPAVLLERRYGLTKIEPDDLKTIIFTSGSTGEPKGVMLSHFNVLSNINAVNQLFHIDKNDVILGVLPFFHSFGYTITLWLPLALDAGCVYHFNPLDGRMVGKLSEKHGVTIIGATPTFLRTYLKRCTPEQLKTLDLAIVGAEKLPEDLANAFKEKFGVEPTEGYGTTELSPLGAFNVPLHRSGTMDQPGTKAGTVGRVMPGATAKVVHPETNEELPPDAEGLLKIKGPNVMKGYLNRDEKTHQVIEQDGWYNTGDIAKIDSDGFIEITGRQSRFSKIGGEMVPHIRIEAELARIVEDPDSEDPEVLVAVTAVPDAKKGERLIVLHKPLKKPVEKVIEELGDAGLPNLWLPSADSFCEVEQIPLLGTGKLDLKGLKEAAMERFG